jgi:hypothetical protein
MQKGETHDIDELNLSLIKMTSYILVKKGEGFMDNATIISVLALCVSAVATILVPFIQLLIEHVNTNKQIIYQAKREALIEALNFVDDYFSYMDWTEDGNTKEIDVVEGRECNIENMTERSRNILNLLCVYSKDKKTIDLFLDLVLKQNGKKTELLVGFREACRKELRLSKMEFDKENVFIAKVSSKKLLEREKINVK